MLEILSVGSPGKLVRNEFGKLALGKGVEVTCKYSIKNDESVAATTCLVRNKTQNPENPQNSPL